MRRRLKPQPHTQQGVALVAVIFLIIVIAGALVVLARLSSQNNAQVNQSLLQARSRQAANAAIEWAAQALTEAAPAARQGLCNGWTPARVVVPAYPAANYSITLNCTTSTYNLGGTLELYNINVIVEYGALANPEYVRTQLTATLEIQP